MRRWCVTACVLWRNFESFRRTFVCVYLFLHSNVCSVMEQITFLIFHFKCNNGIIRLSTLRPVANDLLNDALRLDNELSALAATCSLWSVSKVQINHLGLQNPLWNRKIPWYREVCPSYRHKIWKWYDESLLCCHRLKICNFAMNK